MTGALTSPRDHAGQRAFHAGDDDHHASGLEPRPLRQEAMNAGNADVVQPIDGVAHKLGGDSGFFGHRQVGRSGARDEQGAVSPRDLSLCQRNRACFRRDTSAPGTTARTASYASG